MPCFGCLKKKNSYNVTDSDIVPGGGNYRASTLIESGQVSPASQTDKQFPEHNSASASQRTTPEKVAIPPSPDRERTLEPRNGHVIPETAPQSDDVAMTVTSTTITKTSIEHGEFEETRTVTSAKVTEEDGTIHSERTVVTTDTNGNVPLNDGKKSPKSKRRSSTSSSSSSSSSDSEHASLPEVIVTIQTEVEEPRSHVVPEEDVTDEVEAVTHEVEEQATSYEAEVEPEVDVQMQNEANSSFGAVEYNGTEDGEESVVKETVTVVTTTTSIDHDGDGIPDETVTHTTTTRTYSYEEEEEVTEAPCADEAMEVPVADVEPAAEFVPVYDEPVVEMEPSSEEVVTEDTPLYDEEQVAAEVEPAVEFAPVYDEQLSPSSDEEPEVAEEIHQVSASAASSAASSRTVSPEPDQSPPDHAVSDAPSDELAEAHTDTWDATPNAQFSSDEATTTTVTTTTTTYVVEQCDDEEEAEPSVETTETVIMVTMTSPDDAEEQEYQMNEEEDEPREAERRSSTSPLSSSSSEHEEEKPVDE